MKFALILATALVGACGAVQAQEIGGSYTVAGKNLDGSSYGGTAEINIVTSTTCEITWATGSTSSVGICSRNDDAFAAAYVLGDAYGLVIYKLQEDGTLEGLWTIQGKDGVGEETLTPAE